MNNNLIIALIILTCIAGCGSKAKISGLVPCEGTVTWKEETVEGARIAFTPKDNQKGRSAFAMTDVNGKFKTTTLDADDGIMPGEYFVTVTKRDLGRAGGPPPSGGSESPDAPPQREQMTETYFIPRIYADKETSGLSATISSKGEKDLRFELVGEIKK